MRQLRNFFLGSIVIRSWTSDHVWINKAAEKLSPGLDRDPWAVCLTAIAAWVGCLTGYSIAAIALKKHPGVWRTNFWSWWSIVNINIDRRVHFESVTIFSSRLVFFYTLMAIWACVKVVVKQRGECHTSQRSSPACTTTGPGTSRVGTFATTGPAGLRRTLFGGSPWPAGNAAAGLRSLDMPLWARCCEPKTLRKSITLTSARWVMVSIKKNSKP